MNEERIRQFEEVLAMDPEDPMVLYGLAQLLADADRQAEAIPHLQEALRVKSDYSVCYHLLGLCLEETGDLENAKDVYLRGFDVAKEQGDLHVANQIQERINSLSV